MSSQPLSRLAPCHCGSGKRYKDCHGKLDDDSTRRVDEALDLRVRGDAAEARARLEKIVAADPRDARALEGLGLLRHDVLDLEGAEKFFRAALAIAPNAARTHTSLGMLLLIQDRYAEGWKEFAWRTALPGPANFANHPFGIPRWRGEPLVGRSILLHAEQGLGDTIQFVRFAARLAEEGAHADLFCHAPLVALLSRVRGLRSVVSSLATRPTQDYHAPLGDLAAHYLPSPDAAHAGAPYVFALPDRIRAWEGELAALPRPRIGLVLRGNPLHVNDRNRSVSEAHFDRVRLARGTLVNLQLPAAPFVRDGIADAAPRIRDWDDTAAIVSQLEGVVSVDTAVAHLAGAMGRPVFLLVPFCPDWRWGVRGETTRWYPSMRLFRQSEPGEWAPAIDAAMVVASRL